MKRKLSLILVIVALFTLLPTFAVFAAAQEPPPDSAITSAFLYGIAGGILSVLISYAPGLNTWYAAKSEQEKKLIMLALAFLAAVSLVGLSCAGLLNELFGLTLACNRSGFVQVIQAFFWLVVGNQGVYLITPQTPAVKQVKEARAGAADLNLGRG